MRVIFDLRGVGRPSRSRDANSQDDMMFVGFQGLEVLTEEGLAGLVGEYAAKLGFDLTARTLRFLEETEHGLVRVLDSKGLRSECRVVVEEYEATDSWTPKTMEKRGALEALLVDMGNGGDGRAGRSVSGAVEGGSEAGGISAVDGNRAAGGSVAAGGNNAADGGSGVEVGQGSGGAGSGPGGNSVTGVPLVGQQARFGGCGGSERTKGGTIGDVMEKVRRGVALSPGERLQLISECIDDEGKQRLLDSGPVPEQFIGEKGKVPWAMQPRSALPREWTVGGTYLCESCEAPRFQREFREEVFARGYGCGRFCIRCEQRRSCMGCEKVKAKRHFATWRWDDSQERRCKDCTGHTETELATRRKKERARRLKAQEEKGFVNVHSVTYPKPRPVRKPVKVQ